MQKVQDDISMDKFKNTKKICETSRLPKEFQYVEVKNSKLNRGESNRRLGLITAGACQSTRSKPNRPQPEREAPHTSEGRSRSRPVVQVSHQAPVHFKKSNNFIKDHSNQSCEVVRPVCLHKMNSEPSFNMQSIQNRRHQLGKIVSETRKSDLLNEINALANDHLDARHYSGPTQVKNKAHQEDQDSFEATLENCQPKLNNHGPKDELMITLDPTKFKCDIWAEPKESSHSSTAPKETCCETPQRLSQASTDVTLNSSAFQAQNETTLPYLSSRKNRKIIHCQPTHQKEKECPMNTDSNESSLFNSPVSTEATSSHTSPLSDANESGIQSNLWTVKMQDHRHSDARINANQFNNQPINFLNAPENNFIGNSQCKDKRNDVKLKMRTRHNIPCSSRQLSEVFNVKNHKDKKYREL